MKLELSKKNTEISHFIKKNPPSESRDVSWGWTERLEEANSGFSQLRERA
jgi:hypothetical protein